MTASWAYIVVFVVVLAIVAVLAFFVGRGKRANRLTPLASLAFAFVLAGLIFGDDRLIGYSLLGAGVVLALIDIVVRAKKSA
jgi:uncharacterized membrane protein